jgi:hypothetical protein
MGAMSSAGLASLIAHAAFWLLLFYGWLTEDLSARGAVLVVLMWTAALLLLPYVPYGDALFPPFVALLDIALVLTIFKGDLRLH